MSNDFLTQIEKLGISKADIEEILIERKIPLDVEFKGFAIKIETGELLKPDDYYAFGLQNARIFLSLEEAQAEAEKLSKIFIPDIYLVFEYKRKLHDILIFSSDFT